MRQKVILLSTPIWVFYLWLLSITSAVDAANLVETCCDDDVDNYPISSIYAENLHALLANSFATNTSLTEFGTASSGSGSDVVYGLVQCRGDQNPTDCRSCIVEAVVMVTELCSGRKSATIWFDECQLRYANTNFIGKWSSMDKFKSLSTTINGPNYKTTISHIQHFRWLMSSLITSLISAATYSAGSNYRLVAVNEMKQLDYHDQTMYGLVQCTQDLSASLCSDCLNHLISRYLVSYATPKQLGVKLLTHSCNIQIQLHKFYSHVKTADLPTISYQVPGGPYSETSSPRAIARNLEDSSDDDLWPDSPPKPAAAPATVIIEEPEPPSPPPPSPPPPSPPPPAGVASPATSQTVTIAAIAVASLVSVTVIIGLVFFLRRRYKRVRSETRSTIAAGKTDLEPQLIGFDTIKVATNDFSEANKLSNGCYGPVYMGKLPDGRVIAVEKLELNSGQSIKEFMDVVTLNAKLQHPNLVKLLGFCVAEQKLLVYEFMPNRTLDNYIFDDNSRAKLDWSSRFNIVMGIARGLLYLHQDSNQSIIVHRDLKASNVLLDIEMNPKIFGFAASKMFGANPNEAMTMNVADTCGYMSPEYALEGKFSIKSDVFSFGVLLLEIVSGQKNTASAKASSDQDNLLGSAWKLLAEDRANELVDPWLKDIKKKHEPVRCIHVALLCVQQDSSKRPTMQNVISFFENNSSILPNPSLPAYCSELTSHPGFSANEATRVIKIHLGK